MTNLDGRPKKSEAGPMVVIVGETASGKSTLAMELAERFGGELVCADSWTVYRGFDVGTAKPTADDRARVPHHLLDVADPAEGFSVVLFQKMGKQAIVDITTKGKLPIMVGGTGLYVDSILYDYSFLPPSDLALRAELNTMTLEQVLGRASELGLDTTGIDLRNKRRVIRLIENNGVRPSRHELRANTLVLGVAVQRDELRERIARRVDAMLAAGLESEVRQLAGRYGWEAEPMKGIGYREWQQYFAGTQNLDETRERIIKASMDLAKRQRTWFRHLGYPDSAPAELPFSAPAHPGSIGIPPGMSQSPERPVAQKSSAHQQPNRDTLSARNNGIQWVADRSYAVDLVTTFLNKTN